MDPSSSSTFGTTEKDHGSPPPRRPAPAAAPSRAPAWRSPPCLHQLRLALPERGPPIAVLACLECTLRGREAVEPQVSASDSKRMLHASGTANQNDVHPRASSTPMRLHEGFDRAYARKVTRERSTTRPCSAALTPASRRSTKSGKVCASTCPATSLTLFRHWEHLPGFAELLRPPRAGENG